jgi:prepilin peptidase CpaA
LLTATLLLGIVLFAVAAYGDIKTYKIPNMLVVAIAVLGVLRLVMICDLSFALHTVGASAVVFIVGFLLFWRRFVGGGDAKLVTAAALLIGYPNLCSFLMVMGICGALISLTILLTHQSFALFAKETPEQPLPKARLAIPYGVAIASGAMVTLLFQTSILG